MHYQYITKVSDLVADREWFLELTRQLHKIRLITTGGIFKEFLKELEPEDLISESEDSAEHDLVSLYFGWRRSEKKYRRLMADFISFSELLLGLITDLRGCHINLNQERSC